MLAKVTAKNQKDWDEHLPHVAFFYNASTCESTQYTPHFLMFGNEPRWDVDLKLGSGQRGEYSVNDYADRLLVRMTEAHESAREHLQVTASRMQDWYDKKVHVQTFHPGDEVYLLNLRLYQGQCPKWVRRYSDLATVVKQVNTVTYLARDALCRREKERIVHVDKMKLRTRAAQADSAGLTQ